MRCFAFRGIIAAQVGQHREIERLAEAGLRIVLLYGDTASLMNLLLPGAWAGLGTVVGIV